MVKRIVHPTTGQTVCFGRNRPAVGTPKIHLQSFVNKSKIHEPPKRKSYTFQGAAALSKMYMNDTLGDCVPAAMLHEVGVFTGNSTGTPALFTKQQVVSLYSAIGGYVPGDPSTDNGCDEVTAWNYWNSAGAPPGSNKISGWVSVDGSDPWEYCLAIWLFENLMFGVELPDAWITPFPSSSGFTWGVAGAPDENNGHCFPAMAYANYGEHVEIATWAMTGYLLQPAIAKYATTARAGELYTVLSPEVIERATQRAPSGFDFEQLQAALGRI